MHSLRRHFVAGFALVRSSALHLSGSFSQPIGKHVLKHRQISGLLALPFRILFSQVIRPTRHVTPFYYICSLRSSSSKCVYVCMSFDGIISAKQTLSNITYCRKHSPHWSGDQSAPYKTCHLVFLALGSLIVCETFCF